MAVLGRLLLSSAERLDLPDLLSIDSYTGGDFKYLLKSLVNDKQPYILKGFDVIEPQNAIGTQSCSIRIADSAVFYPGSTTGSFFYGLPEGDPNAQPLVPELRKNAINYVYLTFTTFDTSGDSRAFWDPDINGGVGGEFTQDVNTEEVLTCQVNVSVGAFPANTIPIAKVTVGAVTITAIEDARDMLFRLGSGGISPDPYSTYAWSSLPNSSYQRNEPPTVMTAGGVNPFQGGDKNILSLKEWMDAVMSKLRELGGSVHWYDDVSSFSLVSSFVDAVSTMFKSKGLWLHDGSTPGLLTWSEDINIKMASDPRTYILRNGNKTLANEQVAYLDLIRSRQLNSNDQPVAWTNGQPYINTIGGAVGLFANLSQGDYVKKVNDPNTHFLRVEQFYDSINLGGSVTTAALAKSVRLSSNYLGSTGNERGRYDKGVYLPSDVTVSDRDQAAIDAAGGDFSWLALRSDTIESVANAVTTTLTVAISGDDGSKALVTSGAAHGLVVGDRLTISGSTNFNGTFQIEEVVNSTQFYIPTTGGPWPDESGKTARYATITTAAFSTPYGLQLESANNDFETDDTIIIAGTTNYNGSFKISRRNSTTFTIAISGAFATETTGTATKAKVFVRAESGTFFLIQGESGGISDTLAQNMKSFLGMTSDSQTYPDYALSGYNTLNGTQNFNSLSNDNVTARLSKLTGMMADKAQDKLIKYLPQNLTTITNTTNGSAQEITFQGPGATLTLLQPGSPGNAVITLPSASPGISLLANQVAYVTIDRNNASTPTIQISGTAALAVAENTFVIAERLTGSTTYVWDGFAVTSGPPVPVPGNLDAIVNQDRNLKLVQGGNWSWAAGNILAWDATAFIQVPLLAGSDNQINAGNVTLTNDGDVAYVEIHRTSPGGTLTVSTVSISSLTPTPNTVVIARRTGTSVIVGTHSFSMVYGESKELDAGLSIQNRALLGTGVTEATSNPGYAARGAVNRITTDSFGALDAIAQHDAQFDKYFGQFRMIAKTAGTKTRVRITGADQVVFTGETLGQSMSSLRVSFTGAEIDFATGSIYGGDATLPLSTDFSTALGVNFTPTIISANNYLWYSVGAIPSSTNADNTINVQFNIVAGATSGTTPTLAAKPPFAGITNLGHVVVKDNGSAGSGTILAFDAYSLPTSVAQSKIMQLGVGSGSGSGSGLQKVRLFDPISTTLPTGTVTTDGVVVNAGDLVLFDALGTNNNKIYKAVGTGTNITSWQAQFSFSGSTSPSSGDTVMITAGTGFADQIGTFTGSTWSFNSYVRYFNGADYWEVSSMQSAALANNQVSPADIFSIAWAQSENMIVDYSIKRGTTKETGSITLTTDGTTVGIATTNVDLAAAAGVTFTALVSGSNVHLQYVSTNSGSSGQMKWVLRRWSDAAGGPGGIPSYTGGGGGGGLTGVGVNQQIAIWSGTSTLTGNSNFNIDTGLGILKLGQGSNIVENTILQTASIASGSQTNALLFTYPTSYTFAVVEYSVVQSLGNYRMGTLLITQDSSASIQVIDTFSEVGTVGTTFASPTVTHTINGSNVEIRYNSSGGSAGTFKYAMRRWS